MDTEMQSFYKNKNIFLTGGTGFLGKVFIEKILRATDVRRIYMLIRRKRDKDIYERIEEIFREPLFEKLLKLKGNAAQRITPIIGDCALPGLGLSNEDRTTLIENVDVVVHSAATVRFNEPLSVALAINVLATMDLLQLAKKMTHLKSFVHVSSAFANCIEPHIEEHFYANKLAISASKVAKLADILGTDIVNRLSDELCKEFPNSYCYTKALAEEAVLVQSSELPICIFRPGIVIPTSDEPLSGWIDNFMGPTSILFGAAYGVLRVMYMRIESNAHIVPVDFCANAMLACAWNTAKSVNQISNSPPPIYNLVPDERNALKWEQYIQATEDNGIKMPLPNMVWYPFLIHTKSKVLYKLLCFFYHTVPGYIFDFLLLLLGRKRRMVKTYRKIHKNTAMLDYFVDHEWTFSMDNTKLMWQSLSKEDQLMFNFNMLTIDWPQYFYKTICGMRRFLAKEEPDSIPKGLQQLHRLLLLHRSVQCLVYGGGTALMCWACSGIWHGLM